MSETTIDNQVLQLRRWLEGYIDEDGKRRPGLVEMVGELYEELEARSKDKERRRERQEAIARAIVGGAGVTCFAALVAWIKDHWK